MRNPGDGAPPRARRALLAAALGVAVAGVYLPAARHGYVWDDHALVAPSPALVDLPGLFRAARTDLYRSSDPSLAPSPYHRPAVLAAWYLNSRLPGDTSTALHLGNLALHALAAVLLALLLMRRAPAGGALVAAACAAWWALHPESVEAVAWISGRYDVMSAVAALGLLLAPATGARGAVARALLFALGLGSKEGFVAVLAVVAVDDWAERRPWRAVLPAWIATAATVAAWLASRAALGIASPAAARVGVADVLSTIGIYLGRAVAPLPLSTSHPYAPLAAWALAAVAAALLAAAVAARRRRELATPLALFVAPLVPAAMALADMGNAAERYFYLPSLGLAWLAASALAMARPERLRTVLAATVAVLAAAGTLSTLLRLPDWRDDRTLFTASLEVDPEDGMAHLNLARLDIAAGDLDAALAHLGRAQARLPSEPLVANALADVHHRRGDGPALVAAARRAVTLDPELPQARVRLAAGFHLVGDHAAERAELERLAEAWPDWSWAVFLREAARCESEAAPACDAGLERIAAGTGDEAAAALEALAENALARGDASLAAERIGRLRARDPGRPALPRLERGAAALHARR